MSVALRQPRSLPRRDRAAELIAACSIEISPRDEFAGERLRELFDPGTTVFVNHPGSVTHHDIIAACTRLRRAGFNPVPHIAARRLASFTQASDFVQRAAAEAEVTGALLIGGDPDRPVGPFPDACDLLASGLLQRHGLRQVLFAGYPEGHPRIAARTLEEALRAKLALA
jgi:methylenetetrahydrofolate reductase (NADPH)